jgi:hypothetical protein
LKKKNPVPLTHKKRREAPSLHNVTSHWLHRNCIPEIGCHYLWPRLIALLIKLKLCQYFCLYWEVQAVFNLIVLFLFWSSTTPKLCHSAIQSQNI